MVGWLIDGAGALRGVLRAITQHTATQLLLGVGTAQGALTQRFVERDGTLVHWQWYMAAHGGQRRGAARVHQ